MNFSSLEIIAGLEDAFWGAVQLVTSGGKTALREHATSVSRSRAELLASRSVLSTLRHFYTALNQDRKQAWSEYAKPLGIMPYASFVQVNAPRVAQGLVPERWPPIYVGNKVKNFDMFGNPPAYWTLGPAGVFFGNGHVSVPENIYLSDTLICFQNLTLLPNTDYEVAFEFHHYNWNGGQIKFGLGTQLRTYETDDYGGGGDRVSFTFTTPAGVGLLTLPVIFYARGDLSTCYINNVSVIAV